MSYQCFKEDCKDKVQYVCLCTSSKIFSCKNHFKIHIKMPNTTHIFDSVLSEISEWTKEGILNFLTKEKLKKKKLKHIALAYFTKNISLDKASIRNSLKGLDCDLKEIDDLIIMINQASEEEEAFLIKSIALPPDFDAEKVEETLPNDSESNIKLLCRLGQLRNKKLAIIKKTNNDEKIEQDFKRTCELYENNANHWLLRRAYEEYINAYRKITSLYHAEINSEGINLFKYDIENEEEYVKILENPYKIASNTFFTIQLSNNELFVQSAQGGKYNNKWMSFIIDKNYRVRQLPPTNYGFFKRGIYFNRSIYSFGGENPNNYFNCYYFMRYDLDLNKWKKLKALELGEKFGYNMIIFKRNILACLENLFIWLYSVDLDSFSTILYKDIEKEIEEMRHRDNKKSSILLNSEDRLFVIECNGWIYESGVNDIYTWKKISFSGIDFSDGYKCYCSYNKGGIYFSLIGNEDNLRRYFNFDLGKKEVIEIACYDDNLAIKRLDSKFKIIEDYRENFKLDSDKIKNGYTLFHIFTELKKSFKSDPKWYNFLQKKGDLYQKIGWNDKAIECYNKIIQLGSQNVNAYIGKGNSLQKLGKNIEALGCYESALKFKPLEGRIIYHKGICLHNLGRALEAIECFNELIKIENDYPDICFSKGAYLHEDKKNLETMESFNEFIKIDYNYDYIYFIKGVYLHEFKRNDAAKGLLDRAIDLDSDNLKYYLYRAYILNDLEKEKKAIDDFNTAYYMIMTNNRSRDGKIIYNCLKLLKRLSKLLKSTIEFKAEHKKLRNSSLKNPELLKETDEKELIIKIQNSQLIKRALEFLDLDKCKPVEEIQQISKKVSENRKGIAEIATQLNIFLQDEVNSGASRHEEYSEISSDEEYGEVSSDEEHSKHSSD